MLKTKNTENVSADAKKKPSLDTAGQSSSVDPENLDTTDTLTLARTHREFQGPWEVECSYGGEGDLHRHYLKCTKNPGHKNFIPVDKFSIDNLPEDYRDPNIVEYIRAQADLTVRVTVRYVSDGRPKTVPGSNKPYPCYANRGQNLMTVGTGWVDWVDIYSHDQKLECGCKDCVNSSTPKTQFAIIRIETANHVVFDETEAEHTTCHLFFDNGGTLDTCSSVITLTGMSCEDTDMGTDKCRLKHYTHDLDLANRLKQAVERWYNLEMILPRKLNFCNYRLRQIAPDQQPLLFIVSHPHGCSKQISLGRFTSLKTWWINTSYHYTATTCPGSSGAHVNVPLGDEHNIIDYASVDPTGNHCGAYDKQSGINYCHTNCVYPWQLGMIASVQVCHHYAGSFDDNLGYIDEEDLHKHVDTCQKNPARLNVYPVVKFSMDNLPPYYRNNETLEVIESVSDLTVQVSVTCVSEERPKTFPDTDIPYPWYKTRGGNQMRVGSARIIRTEISSREDVSTPQCRACAGDLPENPGGAYIYVRSAACLIYDRKEAEHTTCRLFFDSGETPDLCNDVVTFTDMVHYCNNGKVGECTMVYAIKDLELAERLKDMIHKCIQCAFSFEELLYRTRSEIETNIPAHVMVSHPHGSAKQISVLYADNQDNVDANENQSHHVSITCPGSVGAPIIVLGYQTLYPCCA